MNHKQFKIWTLLLAHPNEWFSVNYIAYHTDLTSKEVLSFLPMMEDRGVKRDREGEGTYILRLEVPETETDRLRREIVSDFYNVTEDHVRVVWNALGTEWATVAELRKRIPLSNNVIIHTLDSMEGVECIRRIPHKYRRSRNVCES